MSTLHSLLYFTNTTYRYSGTTICYGEGGELSVRVVGDSSADAVARTAVVDTLFSLSNVGKNRFKNDIHFGASSDYHSIADRI
jgi:hypothetical protein